MSKVDDMRAFREAKYAKRKPAPARTPVPARPPVTRAPATARRKVSVPAAGATVSVPASAAVRAAQIVAEPVLPAVSPSVQVTPPPVVVTVAPLEVAPVPVSGAPTVAAPVKTAPVPVPKRGRVPVGARPLEALLEAGVLTVGDVLHGKYKGTSYLATVGAGGVVIMDGVEFDNPSRAGLAAMASTRASLNGWDFWRTSPAKGSRLLGAVRADV